MVGICSEGPLTPGHICCCGISLRLDCPHNIIADSGVGEGLDLVEVGGVAGYGGEACVVFDFGGFG